MKQIKIYFGKQQESVLGSYADVINIMVDDDEADRVVESITSERHDWIRINVPSGFRYINVNNILWFNVENVGGPVTVRE